MVYIVSVFLFFFFCLPQGQGILHSCKGGKFCCYPPLSTSSQTKSSHKERRQIRDHCSAVNTCNLSPFKPGGKKAKGSFLPFAFREQEILFSLIHACQRLHSSHSFPLQPSLFRRGQRKEKGIYPRKRREAHFQPISTYHYPSGAKTSHTTQADTHADVGTFSCLTDRNLVRLRPYQETIRLLTSLNPHNRCLGRNWGNLAVK